MADDTPSLGDKVRYQVDRFLSWSPMARFVGLFGLSFILVLACAVLAKLVMPPPEEAGETFDLLEAMWWAMTRVADAGTMGDDKGTLVRFIATLATLSGVGVVALLIGLVSSTIGDKIEDLRKGRSPVIDEQHTLILGYNEKVFAILRELREANSNLSSASIVILSETDKEEVETAVKERMGDMGPTRVVVRQGSCFSVHDLRKVGAGRAKSIIVLADEEAEGADDAQDMAAIKTLLALRRIPGALTKNHAVVELLDSSRRTVVEQLGAGGVEVVAMAETLSRMMVQTARQNGLAAVYRDLLTYEGSEFYFTPAGPLAGKEYREAQWATKDAVVCGVRRAEQGKAPVCTLNPPEDFLLQDGDELLVIAEDDDSFSLTAQHQPTVPEGFAGAQPTTRKPERLLICGMSPRLGDMLREFDNYVLPGSEGWLMPGQDKDGFTTFIKEQVGGLKNLKLKFVEGDPTSPESLRRVVSPDFMVAMVVADTTRATDEADARTVITVLLLRDLFRAFKDKKPRIISEILDPRTKDLLEQDYGADFVVSAEMTSMLLAQVSERRELNAVFADLFDSDGNEIYLKRAACYALLGYTTPWLTVQKVARMRGEVALGYLKLGGTPLINPPQGEAVIFAEEDRVIVISEDDSEAMGDERGGTLAEPPSAPLAAPVAAATPQPSVAHETKTPGPARSALLPPEHQKAPDTKPVSAGPRVEGPSTMPRPPLPQKPKS
ncbi:MAG: NAD-binding protein [Myxococcaceae bacterium]|nr:NAD-binding protein [Myxococcaceae bacterium]